MSELDDGEVVLALLRYAVEHESELGAGQGVALPPGDWSVRGVQVPPDQHVRAIRRAHGDGYVDVTHIGNDPVPTKLTHAGRRFVEEWGGS